MESALITAGSTILLAALGFLVGVLSGKSRAEVRGVNAKARIDEVQGELSAYDLAQKAINDLNKFQEQKAIDDEKREKKERAFESRISTLEDENKELRKLVTKQNGKIEEQTAIIEALTKQVEDLNLTPVWKRRQKPPTGPLNSEKPE